MTGPVDSLQYNPAAAGTWSAASAEVSRKSISGWAAFIADQGHVSRWYKLLDEPEFHWAQTHFGNSLLSLLDHFPTSAKWSILGRTANVLHSLDQLFGIRSPVVLEIGSGVGENFWLLDRYLRDLGSPISPRYLGIESSPLLAACAHVLTPPASRIHVLQGFASELSRFPDQSVDVILSHTGLNYLADDAHPVLLDALRTARYAVVADHYMTNREEDMFATFVSGHRFVVPSEAGFRADIRRFPRMTYLDCGRNQMAMEIDQNGNAGCFFERPPAKDFYWSQNLIVDAALLKGLEGLPLPVVPA